MGEFSIVHWAVVIVIVLLFFGPSKLPQLGKSLGEAIRDFKKGVSELDAPKQDPPKDIAHTPVQQIPDQQPEKQKTPTSRDS